MWSLPNITELNDSAARDKRKLERAARTGRLNGEQIPCEHVGDTCTGEMRYYLYHDIFSDDPKGVIGLCEHHDGYYGSPTEGYFTCDNCYRVMVENYTWERYQTTTEDGGSLCLVCAAEYYIADDSNWLALTPESIASVDFDCVRKAKHVLGVRMPVPKSIEFVDNAEFDSMDGHQISGDAVQDILTRAMEAGHKRALLILDAGYQFAVSIGVYVDAATQANAA